MKKILTLFLMLCSSMAFSQALVGTYIVGSGETYTSIQSAVSAMQSNGISGHVTLKVKNGTYSENLNIYNIPGAGAGATVTIQSNSNNKNDVTLMAQSSYVLYMSGAKYITFKNLTFTQTIATRIAYVNNNNENIAFEDCDFNGYNTTSSSTSYAIFYMRYDNKNILIKNCDLSNGSNGIYVSGTTRNLVIDNCETHDQYYGYRIQYAEGVEIKNSSSYNITSQALYAYQNTDLQINHCELTGNSYNYFYNNTKSNSGNARIYNNIFHSLQSYGFYLNGQNDGLEFYHNTVLSDYSYAMYISNTENDMKIKNNLFHTNTCNRALRVNDPFGEDVEMDFNAYSNTNSNCQLIQANGIYYNSVFEFANASGQDQNSVGGQANLIAFPTNPKPQNGLFVNTCDPISGITKDINGTNRSAVNPDVGAIEFNSIYNNDMAVLGLESLLAPNCSGGEDIIVKVKNIGLNDVTSYKVKYSVNGNLINEYSNSGTLNAYTTESVTIGSFAFDGDDDTLSIEITDVNGSTDSDLSNNMLPDFRVFDPVSADIVLGGNDTLAGLEEFLDRMTYGGICGDISITIKDGDYDHDAGFVLGSVSLSDPDDQIIIESESGNKEDVVLHMDNNIGWGVINLDGTSNVTIRNLSFNTNRDNCVPAVYFEGICSNITLENLDIIGDTTYCSEIFSFDNYMDNSRMNNVNTMYGEAILYSYANNSSGGSVTITNSTFREFEEFGYIEGANRVVFTGNEMTSKVKDSEGIYFEYCNDLTVSNNIIILDSSDEYGLYLEDINYYSPSSMANVSNNYINVSGEDLEYGVYVDYNKNLNLVNNTIVYNGGNDQYDAALYVDYEGADVVANNIVVNTNPDGQAFYYYTSPGMQFNTNNYMSAGDLGYDDDQGVSFETLEEWQEFSGQDLQSLSVDPMFQGAQDFHVCNEALNDAGTNIGMVGADLDGDPRTRGSLDIGADEFSPPSSGDFLVTDYASLCSGEATLIAAPGASSYSWSTGATTQSITVSEVGQYTVTVNGVCGGSGSDTLMVDDLPIEAKFWFNAYGKGVNLFNASSGSPSSYLWDFGDGSFSSEKNPTHVYPTLGVYTVKLTVTNECGTDTYTDEVSIWNANVQELSNELKVYPNPFESGITLEATNELIGATVQVSDMYGRVVLESTLNSTQEQLDLSDVSSGMYTITIFNKEVKAFSKIQKL